MKVDFGLAVRVDNRSNVAGSRATYMAPFLFISVANRQEQAIYLSLKPQWAVKRRKGWKWNDRSVMKVSKLCTLWNQLLKFGTTGGKSCHGRAMWWQAVNFQFPSRSLFWCSLVCFHEGAQRLPVSNGSLSIVRQHTVVFDVEIVWRTGKIKTASYKSFLAF